MNRVVLSATLAALFFTSCAGKPDNLIQKSSQMSGAPELPFIITDHKNKSWGGSIPEWVTLWYEEGISQVEAMESHEGLYLFIGRNEGNNFNALTQWTEGFSPELDFPRLAASRIEARFLYNAPFPDEVYGSFFNTLIRAASDAPWSGAEKKDDYWLRRKYFSTEDEITGVIIPERETWEFLILVSMEKSLFASQLDRIFRSLKPTPPPKKDQNTAANRVKDKFYEKF